MDALPPALPPPDPPRPVGLGRGGRALPAAQTDECGASSRWCAASPRVPGGARTAGRVARVEIEEARLPSRRAITRRLGPVAPAGLDDRFTSLARALDATAPLAALEAEVAALCGALGAATGIAEEFLPPAPPSPARGQAIFQTHCVSCHGERGAGDGPEAVRLGVQPANFTDAGFMRGETPADFFHVVSVGRRRAAIPPWDAVLSVQERWDAIGYLWSLASPPGRVAEGRGLPPPASCHNATGGRGPAPSSRPAADLDTWRSHAALTRTSTRP
jgi:mono/diheme cytochrome c family protein